MKVDREKGGRSELLKKRTKSSGRGGGGIEVRHTADRKRGLAPTNKDFLDIPPRLDIQLTAVYKTFEPVQTRVPNLFPPPPIS